ncbi:CU044_5270 family protein [Actinoplanes regularis]|uniref:CU044_5270 family protein n=1 Tax=Actinoplanes regularis TaxID=52697 RepID=A0A239F578_9ACTN|nr:CU044_5270 family protein [Actinoplanes regularis]GIE89946.1 hypothetical protein Are01nite_64260 [Actinoplanes regularis]SNS51264.1 hypothetical protein SAMN06264365_11756 [Actinoplanes regularis]
MSKHRDTMQALAKARPSRLEPDGPLPDPAALTAYPREVARMARAPRPGRRLALVGGGVAVVAAVATVLSLRTGVPAPNATASSSVSATTAPTVVPTTAAGLLLVAAERYDAEPVRDGRYWVVRFQHGEQAKPTIVDEQWLALRDGDPSVAYFKVGSRDWRARPMEGHSAANNFLLAGQTRPPAELAALPSDPDRLKARLLSWYSDEVSNEGRDQYLFYCGVAITLNLPVPAPVRAAAYRMLAKLPGITALGRVTDALGRDGMAVGYSRRGDSGNVSQQRLIVDPATGYALAQESWTKGERGRYTAVLKSQWSDESLPDAADLK